MRAVYFDRAGEPLQLIETEVPKAGPGEMVIKVCRCGICGSDVSLTATPGYYPEQSVIGHEYAGEVVELGKGVDSFRVGDRITAISAAGCGHCLACLNGQYLLCEKGPLPYAGGFADYMRVHTMSAARLPDSLSFGDGALVEPLAVGLHGVAMAALTPGTPVLVLGAGAISLAAIYWARRLGAGRIVVMSRSARRAEMALKMGADQFVQMGENELEEVRAAFGGRAPEVVFEGIGVVGALQQSANHVAVNGRIISLGFCTKPDSVLPAIATFKQITIGFSMAYSMREFEWCANALDRGHVPVEALISRVIPLEQVPDTIVQLRAGGGSDIKIQADMSL